MHIIFQIPDVRLKCVLGLQGLYGDPLLLPKLDLFSSRFKVTSTPENTVYTCVYVCVCIIIMNVNACLCCRTGWSPWPWIRTMRWRCRPWNCWCSSPSESLTCLCFLFHSCYHYLLFSFASTVSTLLQDMWWCAQSRGLQAAVPVCLLFTAPSRSHCRRTALLKVSLTANGESKQVGKRVHVSLITWVLLVS